MGQARTVSPSTKFPSTMVHSQEQHSIACCPPPPIIAHLRMPPSLPFIHSSHLSWGHSPNCVHTFPPVLAGRPGWGQRRGGHTSHRGRRVPASHAGEHPVPPCCILSRFAVCICPVRIVCCCLCTLQRALFVSTWYVSLTSRGFVFACW